MSARQSTASLSRCRGGFARQQSFWAVLALVSVLTAACATNPVTGKKEFSLMSEQQEIQAGAQLDGEVQREMGVYRDRELQQYVEGIGLQLARVSQRPHLPWHFTVVDVPAVNAFALPGGYIYITRGILAYLDNEAELAGVLGHEIGHVTARHAAQAYTRAAGAELGLALSGIFFPATQPFGQLAASGLGILFLKYGRDDELQADRLGAEYEAKTGWDPAAVPEFLTTLGRIDEAADRRGVPNWISTHPQPADRVQKIQAVVAQLGGGNFKTDRDAYLRRITGIVFGDNPEEGITRGGEFLHPELRFALQFPDGWDVTNGKAQVLAKDPGAEHYMLLQLVEQPQGRTVDEIAERAMRRAGFRELQGGSTRINGLEAHVGTYEGSLQDVGRVTVRAAHIAHGRHVFLLAGIAPPASFDRVQGGFGETIRSFRNLSPSEAANIQPNRVQLYETRRGDTWQSIAQRAGGGNVKASLLAIMNNHAPNDQPRPGERIKIVVAG